MGGLPTATSASASVFAAVGGRRFDRHQALIALVIIAGMTFMITYVETMVIPAFETFYNFFDHPSDTTIAWILSAYLLVGTIATPIFGKLGDIYGKKKMMLVAMAIYAGAVLCAGFSPNIGAAFGVSRADQVYLLIGLRAVQGIGMGMLPLGFAMLPELFPADRVGQAQGLISAMFAAGACLGLVGGGYLAQTYGWTFTYHTVVPVAILLPLLAAWKVPESMSRTASSIDIPGITALGLGIAALMLGISDGSVRGWTNFSSIYFGPVPWGAPEFFLASVLLLGFFAYWEGHTREPVIRLASLRARNILVANVDGFVVGATMFLSFTTNTYLIELPYPPGFAQPEFIMGLIVLPGAISILVLGPLFGRWVSRWGPKPVLLMGFALMAIGGLLLTQIADPSQSTFSTGSGFPVPLLMLIAPMLLFAGNTAALIAVSNVIVLGVRSSELGVQTAMNQTFRNLGSALAPVIVTSILVALASGTFEGNPMYTVAGFQVAYALLAGISLFALIVALALRNYTRGATAPSDTNAEPLASGATPTI